MRSRSDTMVDGRTGNALPATGGICAILLFYAFAAGAISLLAVLVAVELVLGFAGGRLRWAFQARQAFRKHFALARIFVRSLRLRKTADSSISISAADAPGLFRMIESLCLQTGINNPPQVFLELEVGAWVRLKKNTFALGLGFDLLAGATRAELESVIAHELSHAKLTQEFMRNWLSRGLERIVQLSRRLSSLTVPRRGKAQSSRLARLFLHIADGLGETAARHIAALSRAEEFAADLGAAQIVGPERIGRALLKVEALGRFAVRLPWPERVAQLQALTLAQWLVNEMSQVKPLLPEEAEAQQTDRFSTHPSLRDRLLALPSTQGSFPPPDQRPAIQLVARPEELAERLMAKILESALMKEEWDSRKLRQWGREMRLATQKTAAQKVGAGLVVAAELGGVAAWILGAEFWQLGAVIGTAVGGILLYRMGQGRENFSVPVPDFGLLRETWDTGKIVRNENLKDLEKSILARVGKRTGRAAERILTARSFAWLAETDYTRAGIAARLLLAINPASLPGLLVAAISSAWLGQAEDTAAALAAIQNSAGLRGPSICWGVAWVCLLRGNWTRAEALLEQALARNPSNPTLLNLRALCQLRRGKIQSAIIGARRACEPRPRNREHAKFLIDLLLEGGYMREARTRLLPLDKEIPYDQELMLAAVRLDLASRDYQTANHWAETLLRSSPPVHMIVQMAAHYELARQLDQAERFYRETLARAFFPDACLGLARIEAARQNDAAARRHVLEALNFRRPLGKHATPPLELLRPALTQLALLEQAIPSARAWMASVADTAVPSLLAGMSFLVFASTQKLAEEYFLGVIEAMSGDGPRVAVSSVAWKLAPPEHQPFGPVRPGIQPLTEGAETSPFRGFQRRGLWQPRHNRIQSIIDGLRFLPHCA